MRGFVLVILIGVGLWGWRPVHAQHFTLGVVRPGGLRTDSVRAAEGEAMEPLVKTHYQKNLRFAEELYQLNTEHRLRMAEMLASYSRAEWGGVDSVKAAFRANEVSTDTLKRQLEEARDRVREVATFKFFEFPAFRAWDYYSYYFDKYHPDCEVSLLPYDSVRSAAAIAEAHQLDYVVTYEDMRTHHVDRNTVELLVTCKLYSRKKNEVLVNQDIMARVNRSSPLWHCQIGMMCMLTNVARLSVAEHIRAIQWREYRELELRE